MQIKLKVLWIALFVGFSANVFANDMGTVVGGIAGGILGNNVGHGSGRAAATIGGAVIGSLVGNQVGNSMEVSERHRGVPCRYSQWEEPSIPCDYRPHHKHTFIGPDGRLCRRSILQGEFGDRILVTYCCHHMTSDGYCSRWVRTY